jgi:recombinational DNA repair protein (RecF pathway)
MNFTRCDNCGEVIQPYKERNHVVFLDYMEIKQAYDLCKLCRDTIEGAITQVKK